MLTTIENEYLRVDISDKGAEMMSLYGKKSGTEYLWQGDPQYWANRSTVLFPICGRLCGGKYTYAGKTYEMCIHGIAKLQTFTVTEKTATSVTMRCESNEETRGCYPFDFAFSMTYALEKDKLTATFLVENTGKETLPFSFGGHPGFNVPFDGGKFEDYALEFACEKPARRIVFSDACLVTGETVPFPMEDGRRIPLRHDMFDHDAIFLCDSCQTVTLKKNGGARAITVHFEDMCLLGFWHKPHTEAPYVCIEPWHGIPAHDGQTDDFATKEGMLRLGAGEKYTNAYTVTVTE